MKENIVYYSAHGLISCCKLLFVLLLYCYFKIIHLFIYSCSCSKCHLVVNPWSYGRLSLSYFLTGSLLLILLKFNYCSKLKKIHMELVMSDKLTESEFWATKRVNVIQIYYYVVYYCSQYLFLVCQGHLDIKLPWGLYIFNNDRSVVDIMMIERVFIHKEQKTKKYNMKYIANQIFVFRTWSF